MTQCRISDLNSQNFFENFTQEKRGCTAFYNQNLQKYERLKSHTLQNICNIQKTAFLIRLLFSIDF